MSSSRLTPIPKRSEREHSPPIERAASSSIHTLLPVDPQLGVYRPLDQAERGGRLGRDAG